MLVKKQALGVEKLTIKKEKKCRKAYKALTHRMDYAPLGHPIEWLELLFLENYLELHRHTLHGLIKQWGWHKVSSPSHEKWGNGGKIQN